MDPLEAMAYAIYSKFADKPNRESFEALKELWMDCAKKAHDAYMESL